MVKTQREPKGVDDDCPLWADIQATAILAGLGLPKGSKRLPEVVSVSR